jgi:hypothetical protein
MCVEAIRNEHEADSGVHSHLGVHARTHARTQRCFRRDNCRQFLITQHGDRRARVHVPNSFPHSIQHRRPIPWRCIRNCDTCETANETRRPSVPSLLVFVVQLLAPSPNTRGLMRHLKKTSRRAEDIIQPTPRGRPRMLTRKPASLVNQASSTKCSSQPLGAPK